MIYHMSMYILDWGKIETKSYITEAGLEPTMCRRMTLKS